MAIAEVTPIPTQPLELIELRNRRRESALVQMVTSAETAGDVSEAEIVLAALSRFHRLAGSAACRGFAVPHVRSAGVLRTRVVYGRSVRGVEWGAEDGQLVHLVALVLSPSTLGAVTHVERVGAAMHALRLQRTRQRLLECDPASAASVLQGSGA